MAELRDEHFEVISKNKAKIYEEQKSMRKELTDFIEGFTSSQFKAVEKFFETMPKLSHTIKVKNPNTGVDSEVVLEGLTSFLA